MTFKGVIFDLDGVIVDSVPLHFEAWKRLFQDDLGIHFDLKVYEDMVDGKPRLDAIRDMMPNMTEEEVVAAGDKKQGYYLEYLAQGKLKKFDAAISLIKELLANNIKLAAASSSKNTRRILEKIGIIGDFTAIVTGNDIIHGKPDPEIFLKAADGMGLDVSECVVFEDSIAGVEAAKNGGFLCVGIDRHNKPENYQQADLVVKDLTKVDFALLKNLFNER
ncbi:MAG: HAD family phosphatase [Gammaproteobacteria bacterium]|nr:HAD family phosphatase [Gammaproteobacteria bacterium]